MKPIAIPLLALVLAAPTTAQIRAGVFSRNTGTLNLMFRSGGSIKGKVLTVEGNRVHLEAEQGIATQKQWHNLSDFSNYSAYRIKSAVTPDTAEGQLALARFALEHDLSHLAERCVARARHLSKDPKVGADIIPAIQHHEAQKLENRFHRELGKGQISAARDTLKLLYFRHGKLYDNAMRAALAQKLDDRARALVVEAAEAKAARVTKAQDEAFAREVKPLQHDLQRARTDVERAMGGSRSFGRSIAALDTAITRYYRVNRRAERLMKKYDDRPELLKTVAALEEESARGWRDSLLNQASYYFTRTSYSKAYKNCNKILAKYPGDKRALSMRSRVERASKGGWGWGWGWGRPYSVLPPIGYGRRY